MKAAAASIVTYGFAATLDTGALQGTSFSGSFAFNNAGATGVGQDFLTLTALDFNLLGTRFTLADIGQGGQAFLQDGRLVYFDAAFFPSSPTSPVSDIAFGFGGPGVIGYVARNAEGIGLGAYVITASPVPEPSSLALIALGALMWVGFSMCGREARP